MTTRRRRIIAGSLGAIIMLPVAARLLRDDPDVLRIYAEAVRDDAGHLAWRWTFSAARR